MPTQSSSPAAKQGGAYDVVTHFVLMPIFVINFGLAIYVTIHRWPSQAPLHLWWIVMALALMILLMKVRFYSLRVQDRVIRLEERFRIASLAPTADISRLSTRQFVALRFASDAELPTLVARTVTENLDPKAIKQNIVTWRTDDVRI